MPKDLWPLLKETVSEWSDDDAPRLGASLAYYTIFSLAPLLIIVVFVVGVLWEGQAVEAQSRILAEVENLTGADGAMLVKTMLESTRPEAGGQLATVLGVAALLFGATGVFVQLQGALNIIWDVRQKPGRGIKGFALTRLLSFGAVLGIGFLLLVSLIISAAVSALDTFLRDITPWSQFVFQAINLLVSFGIITLLFAMLFRYLPDVEIAWRDVWIGAAITALLFTLGKFGIGLYLGNSGTASTYGAAGALVVMLLWIYYSAQILFFGAEFTQVYARRYGSRILPASYAVLRDPIPEPNAAFKMQETRPAPAAPPRPFSPLKRLLPILLAFLVGRFFGRR